MSKFEIKRRAQACYYQLRALGLEHKAALSTTIEAAIDWAAVTEAAPPAKPARLKKVKKPA